MGDNHASRGWPMRLFSVVEDSMRPTLVPGDGLVALRCRRVRPGQLRVFRHPTTSSRWLIKRVGEVFHGETSVTFEARSDNPAARGASDSHDFGPVSAAGSYRVVWRVPHRTLETPDNPGDS